MIARFKEFTEVMKNISILNASIALDANLYIPGWTMYDVLNNRLNTDYHSYVDIAYYDDIPVGVLYADIIHIEVYVLPDYRRKGIGSSLISKLKGFCDYNHIAYNGEECSIPFFEKNEIPVCMTT